MTRLVAVVALALGLQTAPAALQEVVDAERAFAARATVIGWKNAFLEFFAEDAVGFDGPQSASLKAQIRSIPDPPRDAQLLWEPRFGDVAASGELGWLTGPSTSINPARNNGAPRFGNYVSVWKRQPDGAFKVVIDVGINAPRAVPFPAGFARATRAGQFTGSAADAEPTLRAADATLSAAAGQGLAAAYRGRLAPGARLHREGMMPMVGEAAILAWLASQQPPPRIDPRYAESARSGDLGYTWGRFGDGAYVRIWTRGADGAWRLALDVVQ